MSRLVLLLALIAAFVASDAALGTTPRPPNYAIAGRIHGDFDARNTVIKITGAVTVNAGLDSEGKFSASGLPGGPYRITPSCPGQTFTPPYHDVTHRYTYEQRGTISVDFQVSGHSTGTGTGTGAGTGGGGGNMPDPRAPGDDQLVLHRVKVKAEKGVLKVTATLVPGAGHAVKPEDGLTLWLNGVPVLIVDGDEFAPRGTSGIKYRCKRDDAKAVLKYTGGWTRSAKIKVKVKGLDLDGLAGSNLILAVTTGDFGAATIR